MCVFRVLTLFKVVTLEMGILVILVILAMLVFWGVVGCWCTHDHTMIMCLIGVLMTHIRPKYGL